MSSSAPQARPGLRSLGCFGTVNLVTLPLLTIALFALAIDGGDLVPAARAFGAAIAVVFGATWLLLLTAVLPDRIGRRLAPVSLALFVLSVPAIGLVALWHGLHPLVGDGDLETGNAWIFVAIGCFFLFAGVLLIFRDRLPWNRDTAQPTMRMAGHGTAPSLVLMVDHLGRARETRLSPMSPSNDVLTAKGATIPSRVAWRFRSEGLAAPLEVVDANAPVGEGQVLVMELVRAGQVCLLLSMGDPSVARMWEQAHPARVHRQERR